MKCLTNIAHIQLKLRPLLFKIVRQESEILIGKSRPTNIGKVQSTDVDIYIVM